MRLLRVQIHTAVVSSGLWPGFEMEGREAVSMDGLEESRAWGRCAQQSGKRVQLIQARDNAAVSGQQVLSEPNGSQGGT